MLENIDFPTKIQSIAFLTGAGISAESGVPTFRDAQTGLWAKYRPEELATPGAFQLQPGVVWQWYQWRRELIAKVSPNAGHQAIAQLEQRVPNVHVITQNVDGLHQDAGSTDVVELHGRITRNFCFDCGEDYLDDTSSLEHPPTCKACGGLVRPGVVWFGESLPEAALERAIKLCSEVDLVVVVGTSSIVQPAASLPFYSLRAGIPVVEINPTETPLTESATVSLRGNAAEVLPGLVKSILSEK